jgi:hypothetical protein
MTDKNASTPTSKAAGLDAALSGKLVDQKTWIHLRMERIIEVIEEMRAEGYCADHWRPLEDEFTFLRGRMSMLETSGPEQINGEMLAALKAMMPTKEEWENMDETSVTVLKIPQIRAGRLAIQQAEAKLTALQPDRAGSGDADLIEAAAKIAEEDRTPGYGPHKDAMEWLAETQRNSIAERIRALSSRSALLVDSDRPDNGKEENRTADSNVGAIVPPHCTGYSFLFDPGVMHIRKDGSGYIVVDENDFVLEDDRGEGPDGPEGSVHWIARMGSSEIIALRNFLNGAPQDRVREVPANVMAAAAKAWASVDLATASREELINCIASAIMYDRDRNSLRDAAITFRCPEGFEALSAALDMASTDNDRARLDDALKFIASGSEAGNNG